MQQCSLCQCSQLEEFHRDNKRSYFQCQQCDLVAVPADEHLSAEAEKAEYDKHQNDPSDSGYRCFLSRTFEPLVGLLGDGAEGLDFGCGPGPAISEMAKAMGFQVDNYDLYYFNRPELLKRQYDFITMTEVIEHIAAPRQLLDLLDGLLRSQGILAIMTKRVISRQAFAQWHYKNDPTHISFYSNQTFEWIAADMNWRLQVIDKDVVFFHKD